MKIIFEIIIGLGATVFAGMVLFFISRMWSVSDHTPGDLADYGSGETEM